MLFLRRQQIRHTDDEAFTRDGGRIPTTQVRVAFAPIAYSPDELSADFGDRNGSAIAPGEFHIHLHS